MKTRINTHNQWNEIVFENRNKLYGAYELRGTYEERIKRALILVFAFVVIIVSIPLIISHFFSKAIELAPKEGIIFAPKYIEQKLYDSKPPEQPKQKSSSPKQTALAPVVSRDTLNDIPIAPIEPVSESTSSTAGTGTPGEGTGESATTTASPRIAAEPTAVHLPWQVDKMPEFPGGNQAFYEFLQDNIHYPTSAREEGLGGTVYVSFIINAEGSVTGVKLLRSFGYGFDEEATRVVGKMPKWKPGMSHGEAVSTSMQLPIKFVIK